jgi:succinate dehydrogenase / fumarate reductase cytochrome b subunit
MAASGCLLFLFVVGHLVGNLQVFLGPEAINAYGHFLQSKPGLVWASRLSLLAIVGLHIVSAIRISAENKAARPVAYASHAAPVAASYASRTMLMSGLIIAAFIVYHLLHFTVQVEAINFRGMDFRILYDAVGRHDVHGMIVKGFSHPAVTGFYLVAMALLCLHLSHGLSAMIQSMGWRPCCPALVDRVAQGVALLIFLGYVSIPVSVLFGLVKEMSN